MNTLTEPDPGATVVVGIDGSRAAAHAAEWAVDEAVARDVPLRLICVVSPDSTVGSALNEVPLGIEYAETVLREADAAIQATGKNVKVDTAIAIGDPATVLLAESNNAELLCIGTVGVGAISRRILGSNATALAEGAHCPVAIIRDHGTAPTRDGRWIAVAVKASTDDEDILVTAMEEARLRHAPVLAVGLWQEDFGLTPYDELDRLVAAWRQRYPDVHAYPVTTGSGLVRFLNDEDDPIGLVVIGADEADQVAQIVGPHSHPIMGHPECSVLVVRH